MEQIVLNIASEKDAELIKQLLKKFKGVEINSFSTNLRQSEIRRRVDEGWKDIQEGRVEPWKDVKAQLIKRIKSKAK